MKQLTRCLGCNKLTSFYRSYQANITENFYVFNVKTTKNYIGRICPKCTEEAGYKVRKKL